MQVECFYSIVGDLFKKSFTQTGKACAKIAAEKNRQ